MKPRPPFTQFSAMHSVQYHHATMRFSIRPYRAADFEAICAIDQACYTPEIAYSPGEMRWYLGLPGAECLLAETRRKSRGKRIAGFLIATSRSLYGYIITIDVQEPYRRVGLGSSLLAKIEARLRKHGVREVWLETATNNEAAIAFWKKHGYRLRARLPNYYPGALDAFRMSKPLGTGAEK